MNFLELPWVTVLLNIFTTECFLVPSKLIWFKKRLLWPKMIKGRSRFFTETWPFYVLKLDRYFWKNYLFYDGILWREKIVFLTKICIFKSDFSQIRASAHQIFKILVSTTLNLGNFVCSRCQDQKLSIFMHRDWDKKINIISKTAFFNWNTSNSFEKTLPYPM